MMFKIRRNMQRLFTLKIGWVIAIFAVFDLICAGLGMGVPIFCILYGFPVGWYIARRIYTDQLQLAQLLGKVLTAAALTSAFTMLVMGVIWMPSLKMLFDPQADLANYGIPLILYEPLASFIGWLALMIVISPFLQMLMTLFGSHLTLLWLSIRRFGAGEHK
jgi:hypothetical protein